MKTAMQVLIDEMEEILCNIMGDSNYQLGYKDSLRDCIIKAKRLLINEKYQAMNDFENGWLDCFNDKGTDKEDYYNQTYNQNNKMNKEELKNDISVSSRLKYITDEKDAKVADFIMDYAFKDEKEVYTNGTILVPLFRVLDAISQKGEQYQEG